jgi:hypothetical protein
MRIALCLSGLPRQVEETYPYLKKAILDRYDVDVFAHTWLEDPWREGSHEKYLAPKSEYETRVNDVTKILRLYKPKSFQIDQYHILQDYYLSNPNYILYTRYCSMLESVYLANEQKKRYEEQNHFKYDCVIRCRFDYGLISEIDFGSYDIQNHIYVRAAEQPIHEQINDMFAFGSSERMDIWCDLFNNMTDMAEKVIREDKRLAEFYKQTHNGPDNHNLYAAWNRHHNMNVIGIHYDIVNWRVGGALCFE